MAELEAVPMRAVKVDETRRDALARARAGEALTAGDLMVLFRVSKATFYRHAHGGDYDALRIHPVIGPVRYAGAKVARYLEGEGMADTDRVFGRRRLRA